MPRQNRNSCEDVDPGDAIVLITCFLLGIILLPMSALVVNDFCITLGYSITTCSGIELTRLATKSSGQYAHGTINTCVSNDNGTCVSPRINVQLYYPPIKHWLLIGENTQAVKSWAAGLAAANSFECRVDDLVSNGETRDGISTLFDRFAEWCVSLIIAVLVWIAFILYGCHVFCEKQRCWNTGPDPIENSRYGWSSSV